MDSKTIAFIVVFAALTIALNVSPVKMPAPYAPFLYYQIWEIPIVAAFLLFGVRIGILVSIINTAALLAIFPGDLPTGPFYNLAAVLSMLLGIYLVHIFWTSKPNKDQRQSFLHPALSTAVGIIFRVGLMSLVNWAFLPRDPPVGFGLPVEAVIASLPLIAFFNATLALYTIPIGHFAANVVSSRIKNVRWNQDSVTKNSRGNSLR